MHEDNSTYPGLKGDSPEMIIVPMQPYLLMERFSCYHYRRAIARLRLLWTGVVLIGSSLCFFTGRPMGGAVLLVMFLLFHVNRRCCFCRSRVLVNPQLHATWCPKCGGLVGNIGMVRAWLSGRLSLRVIKASSDAIVKWVGVILEAAEEVDAKTIRIWSERNGGRVTLFTDSGVLIGEVAFIGERNFEISSDIAVTTEVGRMPCFLSSQIALAVIAICGEARNGHVFVGDVQSFRSDLECKCDGEMIEVTLVRREVRATTPVWSKYAAIVKKNSNEGV